MLKDRTNNLFKQVYEQKSLKGRSNDAIASACLYIACRQEGVPRTFKGKFSVIQIQFCYEGKEEEVGFLIPGLCQIGCSQL